MVNKSSEILFRLLFFLQEGGGADWPLKLTETQETSILKWMSSCTCYSSVVLTFALHISAGDDRVIGVQYRGWHWWIRVGVVCFLQQQSCQNILHLIGLPCMPTLSTSLGKFYGRGTLMPCTPTHRLWQTVDHVRDLHSVKANAIKLVKWEYSSRNVWSGLFLFPQVTFWLQDGPKAW